MTTALHVVLGAAGGTGSAVVRELDARQIPVRAVTRRPAAGLGAGVEAVTADLADAAQARAAVAGAAVVYHAANPPYPRWLDDFPTLNRNVIAAAAAAGARIVFADNLYMYGPDAGVMTEDSPHRASDKKGRLRSRLARELLAADEAGEASVAIGRSSDYFGPGGLSSALGERLFGAAVRGKRVPWLGDADVPHSVAFLPDIARGLVTLGLAEAAGGQVWHLPSCGAPTGREFVDALAGVLGKPLKVSVNGRWMLRAVGLFSPMVRELGDVLYQWEAPFVSSDARFQAAFGPQPATPLDEAVATTLEWYTARATRGGAGG
jgi:nucleoside-diphosphate-sugar epimerase